MDGTTESGSCCVCICTCQREKDLEAGVDAVNARKSVRSKLGSDENECKVDAQVVELAFLCLQFVALSDVFTSLNIPDEPFLADVMQSLLPDPVISKINDLNKLGSQGIPPLVPPVVCPPLAEILDDKVVVDPAPLKGARIPLRSYEINMNNDRDKGLTVGGVQVGVYGWSFGLHFPGSLPYALMLHPELSRMRHHILFLSCLTNTSGVTGLKRAVMSRDP